MARPAFEFDWRQLSAPAVDAPPSGGRSRLRWLLAAFGAALLVVLARAVQLELSGGEAFRAWVAEPVVSVVAIDAPRGRIVARDGSVLAADAKAYALWVHYRYLESPPDPRWLRNQARLRLAPAQRGDPRALAAAEEAVRDQRDDLHRRLAAACGCDLADWHARAARIQTRVAALAADVNRRRDARWRAQQAETDERPAGVVGLLVGLFAPPERLPPAEVIVGEAVAYHCLLDNLPAEVAESIADAADAFPGVKIVEHMRRRYPCGSLAGGIIGHLGPPAESLAVDVGNGDGGKLVGRMGIERACDEALSGRPGRAREVADRRGQVRSRHVELAPQAGRDVVLTLDPRLQRHAEQLLDRWQRRASAEGGAIVVVDVRTGDVLAAASEPRFDPNLFVAGDARVSSVLSDRRRPLFDRATRMAIPPGSVFKPLVAVALLEHGVVDAHQTFECRGYWQAPDAMRCQIFRQQGIGHGPITLADALAQSCNTYFFHHVGELGPQRLLAWARRFGLGKPAAAELHRGAGRLPDPAELSGPGQLQALAIGQGTLSATPLEIARLYAMLARGGQPLALRFTREQVVAASADSGVSSQGDPPPAARLADLDPATLTAIDEGLRRAVDDPAGTAHQAVAMADLPVAAKTGTAEAGGERADHAWFAAYVPADRPRYALVVALEHGGSASNAATLARPVIDQLRRLGFLPPPAAREASADDRG